MGAIQFLQFTSAATGICMGVAMVRGLVVGAKDMGNFYVDFVRSLTRLLIPFCFVAALILVWMGVPQTIGGYVPITTVEGATGSVLVRACGLAGVDNAGRDQRRWILRGELRVSFHEPQPAIRHTRNLPDAPPSDCNRVRLRRSSSGRSGSRGLCSSAPTCSS